MQNANDPHAELPLMKNGLRKTNNSHGYLNRITQFKNSEISKSDYEKSQLPHLYTGRRKFIRMMHDRDQNEEKVTDYVKAGKYLTKVNEKVSTIMFEKGHQYRIKSQNIQRKMDIHKSKSFQVKMDQHPEFLRKVVKELKRHRTFNAAKEAARKKFMRDA